MSHEEEAGRAQLGREIEDGNKNRLITSILAKWVGAPTDGTVFEFVGKCFP
jgi:hypothetical protein